MHIFLLLFIDVSALTAFDNSDSLQITFPCLWKEEASSLEITFEMKSVLKGAVDVTVRVRPISRVLDFANHLAFER